MFEAVSRSSISEQIARQIRRSILNDRLLPGAKLPPERDLANQFGTNRNTLREALRLLEEQGLIRVKQGGGVEVLDYRKHGGIHLLPHYLADIEDHRKREAFIIEAVALRREAMAIVARLAAEAHSDEDVELLQASFQALAEAVAKGRGVAKADITFHRALGRATRRLVVTWLVNTLADAFEKLLENEALWIVEENYLENMRAILDAVIQRDPNRAAEASLRHFMAADEALLLRLKFWTAKEE